MDIDSVSSSSQSDFLDSYYNGLLLGTRINVPEKEWLESLKELVSSGQFIEFKGFWQGLKKSRNFRILKVLSGNATVFFLYEKINEKLQSLKNIEEINEANQIILIFSEILLGIQYNPNIVVPYFELLCNISEQICLQKNVEQLVRSLLLTIKCLDHLFLEEVFLLENSAAAVTFSSLSDLIRFLCQHTSDSFSVKEIEDRLLQCRWIYTGENNEIVVKKELPDFPWIEGFWARNEYTYNDSGKSSQKKSGISFDQNQNRSSGAIVFKVKSSVFGYPFQAIINTKAHGEKKQETSLLVLTGCMSQSISRCEDEYVPTFPDQWALEGQWFEKKTSKSIDGNPAAVPSSTLMMLEWNCSACTMLNAGNDKKCSTCGTVAPTKTISTNVGEKSDSKSSNTPISTNPNPFFISFNKQHMYTLRIHWYNNDKLGIWMAHRRRKSLGTNFFQFPPSTLPSSIQIAKKDCSLICDAVGFSPNGNHMNSMVISTSSFSVGSSSKSMCFQCWVQLKPNSEVKEQVIFANREYELSVEIDFNFNSIFHFKLLLDLEDEKMDLSCPYSCPNTINNEQMLNSFVLVQVEVHLNRMCLTLNSSEKKEVSINRRSNSIFKTPFIIGGRPVVKELITNSGDNSVKRRMIEIDPKSVFCGLIIELRIWQYDNEKDRSNPSENYSSLLSLPDSAINSNCLVGYYPLVGNGYRFMQDISSHEHHGILYEEYVALQEKQQQEFEGSPETTHLVLSLEENVLCNIDFQDLPVKGHFTRYIPMSDEKFCSFLLSGCVSVLSTSSFSMKKSSSLYFAEPVTLIEQSFSIQLLLRKDVHSTNSIWLNLKRGSFWTLKPDLFVLSLDIEPIKPAKEIEECVSFHVHVVENSSYSSLRISFFVIMQSTQSKRSEKVCLCNFSNVHTELNSLQLDYNCVEKTLKLFSGESLICSLVVDLARIFNTPFPVEQTNIKSKMEVSTSGNGLYVGVESEHDVVFDSFKLILKDDDGYDCSRSLFNRLYHVEEVENEEEKKDNEMDNCIENINGFGYGCVDCNILYHGDMLCANCVLHCHSHHQIVAMGKVLSSSPICQCAKRQTCELPRVNTATSLSIDDIAYDKWCCNQCTVLNDVLCTHCTVCNNSITQLQLPCKSKSLTELVSAVDVVEWKCTACTMANDMSKDICHICGTAKKVEEKAKEVVEGIFVDKIEQQWNCSACTMLNSPSSQSCNLCGTAKSPVTEYSTSNSGSRNLVPVAQPVLSVSPISCPKSSKLTNENKESHLTVGNVEGIKHLTRLYKQRHLHVSPPSFYDEMFEYEWEISSNSYMIFTDKKEGEFYEHLHGRYVDGSGIVIGLAEFNQADSKWHLVNGNYSHFDENCYNSCQLSWNSAGNQCDGFWFRGNSLGGEWHLRYVPDSFFFKKESRVGLVNMESNLTNVCYQNSLLQLLYSTSQFRHSLLKAKLIKNDEGNITHVIQDLMCTLGVSERASFASHELQRVLPNLFQRGQQQDSSDFAHFLIDTVTKRIPSLQMNVFGGQQATRLQCKDCGKSSLQEEYFWEVLLNMVDLRYTPITCIHIVGDCNVCTLPANVERLNFDLNQDFRSTTSSDDEGLFIYISRESEKPAITDILIKAYDISSPNFVIPQIKGYSVVPTNININPTTRRQRGVYLYYTTEPSNSPITDLYVVYNKQAIPDGFRVKKFNLNFALNTTANDIEVYLCYRCDLPLSDLTLATQPPSSGYKTIDYSLDLVEQVYLAYSDNDRAKCITDIKFIPRDDDKEEENLALFLSLGYSVLGKLARGSLLVLRGKGNPLYAIDVFRAPRTVPKFKDYEVLTIHSERERELRGYWKGTEETRREHRALEFSMQKRSTTDSQSDYVLLEGYYNTSKDGNNLNLNGFFFAVVQEVSTTSTYHAAVSNKKQEEKLEFNMKLGYYVDSMMSVPCVLTRCMFRNTGNGLFNLEGTVQGKNQLLSFDGQQLSKCASTDLFPHQQDPITDIIIVQGSDNIPEKYTMLKKNFSNRSGSIQVEKQLYLAVCRERSQQVITQVTLVYKDIDDQSDEFEVIRHTLGKKDANLNTDSNGIPIYLAFKRFSITALADKKEKVVRQVNLVNTRVEKHPSNYVKVSQTPMGMEAKLNKGQQELIVELINLPVDFVPKEKNEDVTSKELENWIVLEKHELNGEFKMSFLPTGCNLQLRATCSIKEDMVQTVVGNFGSVFKQRNNISASSVQNMDIWGLVFPYSLLPAQLFQSNFIVDMSKQTRCYEVHQERLKKQQNTSDAAGSGQAKRSKPKQMTSFLKQSGRGSLLIGYTVSSIVTPNQSFMLEMFFDEQMSQAEGWISSNELLDFWYFRKDNYVQLAFKKDYGCEWSGNQIKNTDRISQHTVEALVNRFCAIRTLGSENQLVCSRCEKPTNCNTQTLFLNPTPNHLILTFKRMYYDWGKQKTFKFLHNLTLKPFLTLPDIAEDVLMEGIIERTSALDQRYDRSYGLYGVLVHCGMSANSGHYYSYARDSSDGFLHEEDSKSAPWVKLNDMKINRSSWAEMSNHLSNSVSDSVYLLMYKKIPADLAEKILTQRDKSKIESKQMVSVVSIEEEEEMLVAQGMALSMSEAIVGSKRQQIENMKVQRVENMLTEVENFEVRKQRIDRIGQENEVFWMKEMSSRSSDVYIDMLHQSFLLEQENLKTGADVCMKDTSDDNSNMNS